MQVQALPSGALTMTFGAKSDALAKDISALVVHLYTQDTKLDLSVGKTPALAAVTEVRTQHQMHACALSMSACAPCYDRPLVSFL